jgi:hypothetical protein
LCVADIPLLGGGAAGCGFFADAVAGGIVTESEFFGAAVFPIMPPSLRGVYFGVKPLCGFLEKLGSKGYTKSFQKHIKSKRLHIDYRKTTN